MEDAAVAELSPRERQVQGFIERRKTNREIAGELGISINTVKVHVGNLYRRLGLSRRQRRPHPAIKKG